MCVKINPTKQISAVCKAKPDGFGLVSSFPKWGHVPLCGAGSLRLSSPPWAAVHKGSVLQWDHVLTQLWGPGHSLGVSGSVAALPHPMSWLWSLS